MPRGRPKTGTAKKNNGANLGFEEKLWAAADKMREHADPASRKSYNEWSKEELVREIRKLEKRKKYGIVWEDKPELAAELCKENLPVLINAPMKALNDRYGQNPAPTGSDLPG